MLMAITTTAAWCASFRVRGNEFPAMILWVGFPRQAYFIADRRSVSFCYRHCLGIWSSQEESGFRKNPLTYFHDSRVLGFRLFYGKQATAWNPWWIMYADYRWGVGIPVALAVPSLVILSLWLFLKARRDAMELPGLCRKCGYDLRATPLRCPECGTAATKAS